MRFIAPEYSVPLGVWVVREAVRRALKSKPIIFYSKELMLKYAAVLARRKFGFDAGILVGGSKILKSMRLQTGLARFL